MRSKLLFLLFLFIQVSSGLKAQNSSVLSENDSLRNKIEELQAFISILACEMPGVYNYKIRSGNIEITIYRPFGLHLTTTNIRPEADGNVMFCIPAAYTTRDTTIDGLYILNGQKITFGLNEKLTGTCIIAGDSVRIFSRDEINDKLISEVEKSGFNFFQQSLLIRNSEIVPCNLFRERKNMRRALVRFEDFICIAESVLPVTIFDFQAALQNFGAKDAIYLDMGTWSEGWFKDNNCTIHKIGEKFYNTHLQTNWLIFTK